MQIKYEEMLQRDSPTTNKRYKTHIASPSFLKELSRVACWRKLSSRELSLSLKNTRLICRDELEHVALFTLDVLALV